VLCELWHWRERQAERLDVPPFKVVGNDLLLHLAAAADADEAVDACNALHLGRRERIRESLEQAVTAGLERDPASLPRRRSTGTDRAPLNSRELERQERIREHRDAAARQLGVDPTMIASRWQLALLAREPERITEILLPWQATVMQECPALSATDART
jgi:ribonuclease D